MNNYNGKLVPAGDEEALVSALEFLLSHPTIIEEYSKNAYQSRQKYSFDNVANAWNNFLKLENI